MKKGLVHVYTGDGKGKTTCGVGLALRSLGHDKKVVYAYFHKRPEKYGYAEINMLEKNGAKIFGFAKGTPLFDKSLTADQLTKEVTMGLAELKAYMELNAVDLLVMDEINIATSLGYLLPGELVRFANEKPAHTELVFTGRNAAAEVMEAADYVSFIKKEKHPYDAGIPSREGIEF